MIIEYIKLNMNDLSGHKFLRLNIKSKIKYARRTK